MARITFKQSAKQTLSGTFCGMIYRTRGGKTTATLQSAPFIPDNATAAQKAAHRRTRVLQAAVCRIQAHIFKTGAPSVARMQQIADLYHAIYQHCDERYTAWRQRFSNDERLKQAIVYWYMTERYAPELFGTLS